MPSSFSRELWWIGKDKPSKNVLPVVALEHSIAQNGGAAHVQMLDDFMQAVTTAMPAMRTSKAVNQVDTRDTRIATCDEGEGGRRRKVEAPEVGPKDFEVPYRIQGIRTEPAAKEVTFKRVVFVCVPQRLTFLRDPHEVYETFS